MHGAVRKSLQYRTVENMCHHCVYNTSPKLPRLLHIYNRIISSSGRGEERGEGRGDNIIYREINREAKSQNILLGEECIESHASLMHK